MGYWAWRGNERASLRFRQDLEVTPGEQVLLVGDILRSGRKLSELKRLVEAKGGQVVGLAVMIYQPNPKIEDFSSLPFYYLAQLNATYYKDSASCELCKQGIPVEKVAI